MRQTLTTISKNQDKGLAIRGSLLYTWGMNYVMDYSATHGQFAVVCQSCGTGRMYWIGEETARCTYCGEIDML